MRHSNPSIDYKAVTLNSEQSESSPSGLDNAVVEVIQQITSAYNELPYASMPEPSSHIDHMGVMGWVYGLTPTRIEECRVLDLACSDGGHLIAMASEFPGSEFLGIDLSENELTSGKDLIHKLGLKNVTLEKRSILDIDRELGQFDYIIARGVFSWVPFEVQEKILSICSNNLATHGIAYINYSVYPGGHIDDALRRIMLYHIGEMRGTKERAEKAREILEFLSDTMATDHPFRPRLEGILSMRGRPDLESLFYHEYLNSKTESSYVSDFVDRAHRNGLRFLCEATPRTAWAGNLHGKSERMLRRIKDEEKKQQYEDFLLNRSSRQTLLCRKERSIKNKPNFSKVRDFYVSSSLAKGTRQYDLFTRNQETYSANGRHVTTEDSMVKEVLDLLSKVWPQGVSFKTLTHHVVARSTQNDDDLSQVENSLVQFLGACFESGTIELRTRPLNLVTTISERPKVTALVRYQAKRNTPAWVTNQRHEAVWLDPVWKQVMPLLDGDNTRAMLKDYLIARFRTKEFTFRVNGKPLTHENEAAELIDIGLSSLLKRVAETSLLIE